MMYFFVSTSPKIVIALRPAPSAMSTKFAICLESSNSCRADVTRLGDTNMSIQRNTRTEPQTVADLIRGNRKRSARIQFVIDSTSYGSLQVRSRRLIASPFQSVYFFLLGHLPLR